MSETEGQNKDRSQEGQSPKNAVIQRIGGYLHKITPIVDGTGKVINTIVTPFQIELKPRDIFQMIVGAYLLCVPVAFTEEVWVLSEQLPMKNIWYIAGMSVLFISAFVYSNFYRFNIKGNLFEFIKRVAATYLVSMFAVGLFLSFIDKCPWGVDNILVFKRIVLVSFPSSMAATISDTIK